MSLACRSSGQGADVVLLHGWGMHSGVWSLFEERLAARYRVHCIDLPGHGRSPPVRSIQPAVDWAEACLASAPERAIWVGWSLGGLLSLQAALLAAERISRLVMVAATPCFVCRDDWPDAMPVETFKQFAAQLNEDPQAALDRFLALQVRTADHERTTLRRLRVQLSRYPVPQRAPLQQGLGLLREQDLRSELAHLQCPSLWVFGERDALVPRGVAGQIRSRVAHSQVELLDGAGHALVVSHDSQLESLLTAFLP